jgi:hypothetical protein
MPGNTYPAGQQPVNGDVYFDVTTGATATFRVTENAPTFILTDTIDPAQATDLGQAYIGGTPDIMNWTVDGTPFNRNDNYTVTIVPSAVNITLAATKKGDIVTDVGFIDKGTAGMTTGDFYVITQPMTGNTAGDPWFGIAATPGSAMVYMGADQYKSIVSVEGWPIRNGWILVPNPPAAGAQLTFNLHHQATQGDFAGDTFQFGTKLIVWTGDPDADHGGWVMIPDTAPLTWSVNTPHAQKTPDTVRATVARGYEVRFDITVDAGMADGKSVIFFKGIKTEPAVYEVTVIDTEASGAVYRSLITVVYDNPPSLSPETIIKHNSHFKTLEVGWMGAPDNYAFSGNILPSAKGKSYRVILSSDNHDLEGITGGNGTETVTAWADAKYVDKIDAQKDYPGDELENFLKAKSGDAQASQLLPNRAVGSSMTNSLVYLTGGKLYRVSGYWKNPTTAREAFITIRKAGDVRITTDDCLYYGFDRWQMHGTGYNQTGAWGLNPSATPGFFPTSYGGAKKDIWNQFWFDLDLRDPDIQKAHYKGYFRGTDDSTYAGEWWLVWDAKTHDAKNFYFSAYDADSVEWKVYFDN